ncbi:hypothetical protein B0H12DRAFT_300776 [Mycena haematopus]|nr:hypothetical protein B0H12DRAFT_300776 [Mycena haematopus]
MRNPSTRSNGAIHIFVGSLVTEAGISLGESCRLFLLSPPSMHRRAPVPNWNDIFLREHIRLPVLDTFHRRRDTMSCPDHHRLHRFESSQSRRDMEGRHERI